MQSRFTPAACKREQVYLPLNTAYTSSELEYFGADSGATLSVCDPGEVEALAPSAEANGATLETMGPDGADTLKTAAADASIREDGAHRDCR